VFLHLDSGLLSAMFVHCLYTAQQIYETQDWRKRLLPTNRYNLCDFYFNTTYKKHLLFCPERKDFHKEMINPMKEIHYLPQVLNGTQF